jgi:hypothetical protein
MGTESNTRNEEILQIQEILRARGGHNLGTEWAQRIYLENL